jgi:hypothetical protein
VRRATASPGSSQRFAAALGLAVLAGRSVPGGGPYRPVAEALLARLRDGADELDPGGELRPFRPALTRLLPGWDVAGPAAPAAPSIDPVVVLGEGVLRRGPRPAAAGVGGPTGTPEEGGPVIIEAF